MFTKKSAKVADSIYLVKQIRLIENNLSFYQNIHRQLQYKPR